LLIIFRKRIERSKNDSKGKSGTTNTRNKGRKK